MAALALVTLFAASGSAAGEWEGGFTVSVSYQELSGENQGFADVTLTMMIPMGTPLLSKEIAIRSALSALRDIWNFQSVHEEVLGLLGPQIPPDVQRLVAQVEGTDFVMAVVQAFETVENAGFSRIQFNTPVSSTERVRITERQRSPALYPDAPRSFVWIVGGQAVSEGKNHEGWVLASLVNYSAAVLSFRSEFGRFPSSIAEVRESGHLFIEPLNPYTGERVRDVRSPSPGDISYQFIDNNRVVLYAYVEFAGVIDVVTREINLYSSGTFDLLYRQTAGLTDDEKKVARYVFQISQILNEYYSQHGDLPYSVPQCETEGFAYVSFPNPYSGRDALQADSLAQITPGDYTYHRISSSAYFLVGYGEWGKPVLSVSKDFSEIAPMMTAPMRSN